MIRRWCALATLTLFAASAALADETAVDHTQFTPPNDGYDWIQLKSGEWLKGELIAVFDDEVEFDSDVLDDLVIDGEDVLSIVSPRTFGVSVRGAPVTRGRLELDDKNLIVINDSGRQEFPRDQLVVMLHEVGEQGHHLRFERNLFAAGA